MTKYSTAVGISLLLAASASTLVKADGLYNKSMKDAPIEPLCCETNWTGFYIAGSIGYGVATSEVDFRTSTPTTSSSQNNDISSDGFIGTVGGGYDRDFSGIVVGVFGDYTFGRLKGSGTRAAPGFIDPYSLKLEDSWAVGGRVGVSRSSTLYYVTAGYTETEIEFDNSVSKDLSGYFVGGGVEQKLKGGLSMKLEYRYSDYDNFNVASELIPNCCTARTETSTDTHAIRIGLAYKFGAEQTYESMK